MADKNLDDDYGTNEDSNPSRGQVRLLGRIPRGVIQFLKWTLVVLLLIGVMILVSFITFKALSGPNAQTGWGNELREVSSPNRPPKTPILSWFDQIEEVRTRSADIDSAMIIVKVSIGFDKEDQETLVELIDRQIQIHDTIRSYFSKKRKIDLQNDELVKRELVYQLNQLMNTQNIKSVAFKVFDVLEL